MTYRAMLTEQYGKSTRIRSARVFGRRVRHCLVLFPRIDKIAIVMLPGVKILLQKPEPGNKNTAQYPRLNEKVIETARPFPDAP